jgi:hypothetical protein
MALRAPGLQSGRGRSFRDDGQVVTRTWTCRKCGGVNPRTNAQCIHIDERREMPRCTGRRPAKRIPKHREIMAVPYERWVEQFGEVCGICGAKPSANRRLDRDHDHKTGAARGILCHSCNRRLWPGSTVDWHLNAAKYLDRSPIQLGEGDPLQSLRTRGGSAEPTQRGLPLAGPKDGDRRP